RGMRIMSFNANGLRSAASKGFFDWFAGQDTDILCVQETKAQEHQLREAAFLPEGYGACFRDATTKKGYSGVAVYSRREPDEVRQGFKFEAMDWLRPILDEWLHSGRDYVLCGDWNIVRSAMDIRNWKGNQKNSGCLPAERDWLNALCADEGGWVDTYRALRPE